MVTIQNQLTVEEPTIELVTVAPAGVVVSCQPTCSPINCSPSKECGPDNICAPDVSCKPH